MKSLKSNKFLLGFSVACEREETPTARTAPDTLSLVSQYRCSVCMTITACPHSLLVLNVLVWSIRTGCLFRDQDRRSCDETGAQQVWLWGPDSLKKCSNDSVKWWTPTGSGPIRYWMNPLLLSLTRLPLHLLPSLKSWWRPTHLLSTSLKWVRRPSLDVRNRNHVSMLSSRYVLFPSLNTWPVFGMMIISTPWFKK